MATDTTSEREIARAAGLKAESHWGKLEDGVRPATLTLTQIATELEIDPGWLILGIGAVDLAAVAETVRRKGAVRRIEKEERAVRAPDLDERFPAFLGPMFERLHASPQEIVDAIASRGGGGFRLSEREWEDHFLKTRRVAKREAGSPTPAAEHPIDTAKEDAARRARVGAVKARRAPKS